ncbi:MAG: hypothetical protein FWE38_01065 [Firmicutes bacterium]|nr:hypothetical protein [Bacillota bacterium]
MSTREHFNMLATLTNSVPAAAVPDQNQHVRNRHFRVTNDIDFGGANNPWVTPIGINATFPFSGNFDGGGFTISNIFLMEETTARTNYGLFGFVQNANIRNLNVSNVSFTIRNDAAASQNIGSVAGQIGNNTHLHNVRVIGGNIIAAGSESVGGVVGLANNALGQAAPNTMNMVQSGVHVTGRTLVGGVIGHAISTAVHNSFSANGSITVTGETAVAGGLIGQSTSQNSSGDNWSRQFVSYNSFSTINVHATSPSWTGHSVIGGLIGNIVTGTSWVVNSYASGNLTVDATTGIIRAAGLVGHTQAATVIRNSAAVNANVGHAASTGARHIARLATFGPAPGANNRNNIINSQMGNNLNAGAPFAGNQWDETINGNQMLARTSFNTAAAWTNAGFNFSTIWAIDPGINGGLPFLRAMQAGDNVAFRGDGTAARPFLISNITDLVNFRNAVNSGNQFVNQHLRMTANITINEPTWEPIGNASTTAAFGGNFDGGGFTVSGMVIENRAVAGNGFFGNVVSGAVIRNLALNAPSVTISGNHAGNAAVVGNVHGTTIPVGQRAGANVVIDNVRVINGNVRTNGTSNGMIVGTASGHNWLGGAVTIRNSTVTGSISGLADVGGILGTSSGVVIENTSFNGTVHRDLLDGHIATARGTNMGGILGNNNWNTRIVNSFARGLVSQWDDWDLRNSDQTAHVGGMVGLSSSTLQIINSYFQGDLEGRSRSSAPANVSGFVGRDNSWAVTITNSFVVINNIRIGTNNVGWHGHWNPMSVNGTIIRNNVFSNPIETMNVTRYVFNLTAGTYETDPWSQNPSWWAVQNANHERPIGQFQSVGLFNQSVGAGGLGWDMAAVWQVVANENGGFPRLRTSLDIADSNFRGNGTETFPFMISTLAQFVTFRDTVNLGTTFAGVHFRLETSLDISGFEWIPIGITAAIHFGGTFDGNNHTINGLTITTRALANNGLFGYTINATLRNLTLTNVEINRPSTHASHGALVGYAQGASNIYNIRVEGGRIFNHGSNLGGVIGMLDNATNNSFVDRISANIDVIGNGTHIGGLIGYASSTIGFGITITNSYFEGTVQSFGSASSNTALGGLIGYARGIYLATSFNAGTILSTTPEGATGGLIGRLHSNASAIRDSYNVGPVTGNPRSWSWTGGVGGIIGNTHTVVTLLIENVFNAGEVRTLSTLAVGGIIGQTESDARMVLRGVVSIGPIRTQHNTASFAWFVNGHASSPLSLPTAPASENNLFYSGLSTHISTQTNTVYHTGAGIESRSMLQLQSLATYSGIGWRTDVWGISPDFNDGFPYLIGVSPTETRAHSREERTIQIDTREEFMEIQRQVNTQFNSFGGRDISVNLDLDFSDIPEWVPIGNSLVNRFMGRIDFNDHVITGLRTHTMHTHRGLFGFIGNGAEIRNLEIYNPEIRGSTITGILTSQISYQALIENVHITGANASVTNNGAQTGSLVGDIVSGFDVQIRNSSSTANVTGTGNIGGIVGRATGLVPTATQHNPGVQFFRTFATGRVHSTSSTNIGGFIGHMQVNVAIRESYAAGNAFSPNNNNVGGMIGSATGTDIIVENSFALGAASGFDGIGGFIGNYAVGLRSHMRNIYAMGMVEFSGTTSSGRAAGLIGHTSTAALNFSVESGFALNPSVANPVGTGRIGRFGVASEAGTIPSFASFRNAAVLDRMVIGRTDNAGTLHGESAFAIANGVERLTMDQFRTWNTWHTRGYSDAIWAIASNVNGGIPVLRHVPFNISDQGEGESLNTLYINNFNDLADFRSRVNSGNNFFGQTVSLQADIDMAGTPSWIPIGNTTANFFAGTFEGNGFFIRNFHFNSTAHNMGFFGFTRGAMVRNLTFTDVDIHTTGNNIGVVVGTSIAQITIDTVAIINGSISNTTGNNVGGFVGEAQATQNSITHSYLDNVVIRGGVNIGGFVGTTPSVTVTNSYFEGEIHGTQWVTSTSARIGGIVGTLTQLAGSEQTLIRDVAVSAVMTDHARHNAMAGGVIGMVTSTVGARIQNVLLTVNIEVSSITSSTYSVAGGFVGWINANNSVSITNSVFARGSLSATSQTAIAPQVRAIFATSSTAIAISQLANNRINGNIAHGRAGNVNATYHDYVGEGTVSDTFHNNFTFFQQASTYTQIGWDLTNTWAHDEAINTGLPYLRNLTAVAELLSAAIAEGERFLADHALDYSTPTLAFLQSQVNWARSLMVATGGNLTREELFIAVNRINGAIGGLRAADNGLSALVTYVRDDLLPHADYFVSFNAVLLLLGNAEAMLQNIDAVNGNNRTMNSHVQQMHAQLTTAVNNLRVNINQINTLLATADALQQRHYTSATWLSFDIARSMLRQAIASNASSLDIIAAYIQLQNQMNSLDIYFGRLRVLEASSALIILGGPVIDGFNIPVPVWNAHIFAHGDAWEMLNQLDNYNAVFTTDDLDRVEFALITARNNLVPEDPRLPPARTALSALIDEARALSSADWSTATWSALQTAVANAINAIAESGDPLIDVELRLTALNARNLQLTAALNNMEMNVWPLQRAINNAEQRLANALIPGADPTNDNNFFYAVGGVSALRAALTTARGHLSDPELSNATMTAQAVILDGLVGPGSTTLQVIAAPLNSFIATLNTFTNPPQDEFFAPETVSLLRQQITETEARRDAMIENDTLNAPALVAEFILLEIAFNALSVSRAPLQAEISRALQIREEHVTAASWIAFSAVLEDAIHVDNTERFDVQRILDTTAALTSAINAVVPNRGALEALWRATTEPVMLVNTTNVTVYVAANFVPDTWDMFVAHRTAANTAWTSTTNTVFAVQLAYDNLRLSRQGLRPQRDTLYNELDAVRGRTLAIYTLESRTRMIVAMQVAQEVLDHQNPTIVDVLSARHELALAVTALQINANELLDLLATVAGFNPENFTSATWNALMTEVNAANAFIASNSTSASELAARIAALSAAIDNLEFDDEALQRLIIRATEILDYYSSNYTTASMETLQAVLDQAIIIADSGTFEQITSVTMTLATAVASRVSIVALNAIDSVARVFTVEDITNMTAWNTLQTHLGTVAAMRTNGTNAQVAGLVTAINNAVRNLISGNNFTELSFAGIDGFGGYENVLAEELDQIMAFDPNEDGTLPAPNLTLIRIAIDGLVSTYELSQIMVVALFLNQNHFTVDSWTLLQETIVDSEIEALFEAGTNALIAARIQLIQDALDGLEFRTEALESLLSSMPGPTVANLYTVNSFNALMVAIDDANDLLYYGAAEFAQITAMITRVQNAYNALVSTMVGFTNLRDRVNELRDTRDAGQANWTIGSWLTFVSAFDAAAQAIINAANNDAVAAALSALNSANAGLVENISLADKTALQNLYNEWVNFDPSLFISGAPQLQSQLTVAFGVLNNVTATQDDVDFAYGALRNAVNNLVAAAVPLEAPVADLDVNGRLLTWNAVDGAVSYIVVINGDIHYPVDGTSLDLSDFADGFWTFFVIAVGDGTDYANSLGSNIVSGTFITILPNRDTPTGLTFNFQTRILSWNPVAGADNGFYVIINGMAYIVTGTSFDINFLVDGDYEVWIVTRGNGTTHLDSAPSTAINITIETIETQELGTPELILTGRVLSWNPITGAIGYIVTINGVEMAQQVGTTFNLNAIPAGEEFTVTVRAIGDGFFFEYEGEESGELVHTFPLLPRLNAPTGLFMDGRILHWSPVTGALSYIVYVNGVPRLPTLGTSFNFSDLSTGVSFDFAVVAVGDGVTYDNSNSSSILAYTFPTPTIPELGAPTNLHFVGRTLHWNVVPGAIGFVVYVDGVARAQTFMNAINLADIAAGTLFEVFVVAIGNGVTDANSVPSATLTHIFPNPVVPQLAAPSNLTMTDRMLSWDAVTNAVGYIVFVNGLARPMITGTSFNFADLEINVLYQFTVVAVGDGVNFADSLPSAPVFIHIFPAPVLPPLNAPTGLAMNGRVLSWNAVDGAAGYIVMVNGVARPMVVGTSFNFADLEVNTLFQFVVIAIGNGTTNSDSVISAALLYTFAPPTLPRLDTVTGLAMSGTELTWNAVSGAIGYIVFVNGAPRPMVTGTSFNFADLTYGVPFGFMVIAVGATGEYENSLPSEVFTYTFTAPTLPQLDAPSGLTMEGTTLRWDVVTGAIGYIVFINGTPMAMTDDNFFDMDHLARNVQHYFVIVAIGDGTTYSNSPVSSPVFTYTFVLVLPQLNAPTGLTMTDRELSWTAVSGAVGYIVYVNGVARPMVTTTYILLNDLDVDIQHTFRVVAIADGVTAEDSDQSAEFTYTFTDEYVPAIPLTPPTILGVENGILSWTPNANAVEFIVEINGTQHMVTGSNFNISAIIANPGTFEIRVRAVGDGVNFLTSDWSATFTHNVIVTDQLSTPTNLAIDAAGVLTWNVVLNADFYVVFIVLEDGSEEFIVTRNVNNIDLSNLPVGVYYVFVMAASNNIEFEQSELSYPITFISPIPQTLTPPTILGVENGILSWTPNTNAVEFIVEINGTPHTVTGNNFNVSTIIANPGTFDIRIRAIGNGVQFLTSNWSSIFTHTVISMTQLATPTNLAIDGAGVLTWNVVPNADFYVVFVVTDDGSEEFIIIRNVTNVNLANLPDGVYNVFVTANSNDIQFLESNPSSSIMHTVTGSPVTELTQLATPTGLAINGTELSWSAVTNATGYLVIAEAVGTSDTIIFAASGASIDLDGLLADGVYNLFVMAMGDLPWINSDISTQYATFVVLGGTGTEPTALANPTGLTTAGTMLLWNAHANTNTFAIYIDNVFETLAVGNFFNLAPLDLGAGSHTIHIRAVAETGQWLDSGLSAPTTFTITQLQQLATPTGLAINGTVLSWTAVPNASSYLVFAEIAGTEDAIMFMATGTTFNLNGLLLDGTYNLFVMAVGDLQTWMNSELSTQYVTFVVLGGVGTEPTALASPTGLSITGNILIWDNHANTNTFAIYVDGDFETSVTGNFFNLGTLGLGMGDHIITIRAIAETAQWTNSNLSAPATFTVTATPLAPPANISVSGNVISWDAVTNATSYNVVITMGGNVVHTATVTATNAEFTFAPGVTYVISVTAATTNVDFTNSAAATYTHTAATITLNTPTNLRLEETVLHWDGDSRATGFEIRLNGLAGSIFATTTNIDLATILPNLAGTHTIEIRATGPFGFDPSEWSASVTIQRDAEGGIEIIPEEEEPETGLMAFIRENWMIVAGAGLALLLLLLIIIILIVRRGKKNPALVTTADDDAEFNKLKAQVKDALNASFVAVSEADNAIKTSDAYPQDVTSKQTADDAVVKATMQVGGTIEVFTKFMAEKEKRKAQETAGKKGKKGK